MRLLLLVGTVFTMGCGARSGGQGDVGAPGPSTSVAAPDTIPCDSAVVINASNESRGIASERRWLADHFPGHGGVGQALTRRGNRHFDVMTFKTAEGRPASVCFDIESWFGVY